MTLKVWNLARSRHFRPFCENLKFWKFWKFWKKFGMMKKKFFFSRCCNGGRPPLQHREKKNFFFIMPNFFQNFQNFQNFKFSQNGRKWRDLARFHTFKVMTFLFYFFHFATRSVEIYPRKLRNGIFDISYMAPPGDKTMEPKIVEDQKLRCLEPISSQKF